MKYSVQPPVTAEEWLFSCVFEKKKVFLAEENSDLLKENY